MSDCPSSATTPAGDLHPAAQANRHLLYKDQDLSPQDAWFAIEDLWLRLGQTLRLDVGYEGGDCLLTIGGLRLMVDPKTSRLCAAVADAATYQWHVDGRRGTFVRSIAFEGDDLVLGVTSMPTISRWQLGDDVGWQVKAVLLRLQASREQKPG